MNKVLLAAMTEAGETAESLAAQVGVDPKTAGRWVTPGRIPQPRRRAKIAEILKKDVSDLWPDVLKRREPTWLREWVEWEREATALRWFELAWVPGLLQTEAYARATLAGELLTKEETDRLVASRIGRQSIVRRDRPPMLVAVMDESVLRRSANGDRKLMREQVQYIIACSELPGVQVHVVPASVGMYPGLGGPFILADLPEGARAAHVDSQVQAQIVGGAAEIATLGRRWERIRGKALPEEQTLDLLREVATSWT
ncbi:Scr1 family TA system antitoxin-like transcriptional regulator [Micromonospora sp. NPDC050417]|uniref:Scr1 family TA system antitoxin-like transcriptional regulator n=1 Tax=Micromonospora sp. NPDC050417 TaxID=3364280 RepID=UPI0037A2B5B8